MGIGDSVDNPQTANLTNPAKMLTINRMDIDMERFAQAAEALNAGVYDILTIDGYRDAKGQWVPDYSSIRIEKRHEQGTD